MTSLSRSRHGTVMNDRERLAFWLAWIIESLAIELERQAKELRACI